MADPPGTDPPGHEDAKPANANGETVDSGVDGPDTDTTGGSRTSSITAGLRTAAALVGDGLAYPLAGEQPTRRFALGTVFTIPIVYLPLINAETYAQLLPAYLLLMALGSPVSGYFLRIVQGTVAETDEPPVFEQWPQLIVSGLKAGVVYLVFLVLAADLLGSGLGIVFDLTLPLFEAWIDPSLLTELVIVVTLLSIYPAAVGALSEDERLKAAVDIPTLWPALRDREYQVAALAAAAIFVLSQLSFLALSVVLFLVGVPAPLIVLSLGGSGFYFGMAYNRLIGLAWAGFDVPAEAADRRTDTTDTSVE